MAYITIPLTGSGDATARVATDQVGSDHFQYMKLADGAAGSTLAIEAKSSAPNSTDLGLLVRTIGGGAGSTMVDANLTSAGSTRLVGKFEVNNPTTAITVDGSVAVSNPTTAVTINGSVTLSNPSTAVNIANQPTVDLSSVGSTKLVGQMTVANPTTAVNIANPTTSVTITNGTTSVDATLSSLGSTRLVGRVDVSSGVILGAGSSANMLGSVAQGAGSTSVAPWYVISSAGGGGSTTVDANLTSVGSTKLLGQVTVANPTTSVTVSSGVILAAGSSANIIGGVALSSANPVYLGLGTSATYNFMQSIPFSSGNLARTTVNTTVDASIIAANANRKALIIANASTAQRVALGFSTAAVTTGLVNANVFLEPSAVLSFGLQGGLPLWLGPIRGINVSSTTVAGGVNVAEFS